MHNSDAEDRYVQTAQHYLSVCECDVLAVVTLVGGEAVKYSSYLNA